MIVQKKGKKYSKKGASTAEELEPPLCHNDANSTQREDSCTVDKISVSNPNSAPMESSCDPGPEVLNNEQIRNPIRIVEKEAVKGNQAPFESEDQRFRRSLEPAGAIDTLICGSGSTSGNQQTTQHDPPVKEKVCLIFSLILWD